MTKPLTATEISGRLGLSGAHVATLEQIGRAPTRTYGGGEARWPVDEQWFDGFVTHRLPKRYADHRAVKTARVAFEKAQTQLGDAHALVTLTSQEARDAVTADPSDVQVEQAFKARLRAQSAEVAVTVAEERVASARVKVGEAIEQARRDVRDEIAAAWRKASQAWINALARAGDANTTLTDLIEEAQLLCVSPPHSRFGTTALAEQLRFKPGDTALQRLLAAAAAEGYRPR